MPGETRQANLQGIVELTELAVGIGERREDAAFRLLLESLAEAT